MDDEIVDAVFEAVIEQVGRADDAFRDANRSLPPDFADRFVNSRDGQRYRRAVYMRELGALKATIDILSDVHRASGGRLSEDRLFRQLRQLVERPPNDLTSAAREAVLAALRGS